MRSPVYRPILASLVLAEWDGRNERGARLPTGVYFYELRLDGEVVGVRKAIMLK